MTRERVPRRHRLLRRTAAVTVLAVVAVLLVACGDKAADPPDTSASTSAAPPATDAPTTDVPGTAAPASTEAPATTAAPAPTAAPVTTPATTAAPATTAPAAPTTEAPVTTEEPAPARTVSAYFHRTELIGPVARPVAQGSVATSRAALEALLAGPTTDERALGFGTEIPAGTRLLGVRIDVGVSFVDLSSEFEAGGGSSSMAMRLAQLVYTVTQFDNVDAMRLLLDGVAVEMFSGEGLIVDHPVTRAELDQPWVVPLILVEGPRPFETVTGKLRVWGSANVFEATLQLRVETAGGEVLFDNFVTATCGSGCRGTFDVTIPVDAVGAAIVTVYEDSPRDGLPLHVVEIPITLT